MSSFIPTQKFSCRLQQPARRPLNCSFNCGTTLTNRVTLDSFKSAATQELQKKLDQWAERAEFDHEDLWDALTYKPTSTTRGR
jgi:hypothetical protein